MGAVFAIFSGFYYWFGKITGYLYSETLGRIHFWVTFIGVNITFFPMHILGVSGMPRRIPDYPDMYSSLNLICSIGSLISFIGVILWFYIILLAYSNKIICPKNPWQFYSSNPELLNRLFRVSLRLDLSYYVDNFTLFKEYVNNLYGESILKHPNVTVRYDTKNYKVDTLEWVLDSPPELHTFVSSPIIYTTSKKYYDYRYKKMNEKSIYSFFSKITKILNFNNSHFISYITFKIMTSISLFYNSKFMDTNITYPINVERYIIENISYDEFVNNAIKDFDADVLLR